MSGVKSASRGDGDPWLAIYGSLAVKLCGLVRFAGFGLGVLRSELFFFSPPRHLALAGFRFSGTPLVLGTGRIVFARFCGQRRVTNSAKVGCFRRTVAAGSLGRGSRRGLFLVFWGDCERENDGKRGALHVQEFFFEVIAGL